MNEADLLQQGWRRCAEGQGISQWCPMAESAGQELREMVTLLDDARIHTSIPARDSLMELMYLLHEMADALGSLVAEGGADRVSPDLKARCHHILDAYLERLSYQGPRSSLPQTAED